jgi:GAF domain-containing protein/anti-sigma regulatory factor (Ser/Thr protein kinase)
MLVILSTRQRARRLAPRTRGVVSAGVVGALIGVSGVIVAAAVLPLTDEATYAPLVGAVTLAVWFAGGIGGATAVVAGWGLAYWALTPPSWTFSGSPSDDLMRWATSLIVGLVVAGVGWTMRRGHERAAHAADRAEHSHRRMERLQQLAASLSAALTPEDVARVMLESVPSAIGAHGGALGLIDGDELVIVDPVGAPGQTLTPGSRIPLATRAPITTAARDGVPAWAQRRREFAHRFPDGAALAPYASGALAVPVRVGDRVVGAMGFPFDHSGSITEEVRAIAAIAADLGGQALERASLYAQERSSREGLDRILALAPRFQEGATPEQVAASVCAEARRTFGCDIAQVWTPIDGERIEVTWRDPPSAIIPRGTRVAFANLPGLDEEMSALQAMFVPNVRTRVLGEALRHAREEGVFSSLRLPIVIGGRYGRILVLQWERIVPEPSPATLALTRRYADQAGLAIEQSERRRAQDETRRLQAVTEALAAATTPLEVGEAVVRQGVAALGARAAALYLVRSEQAELELLAAEGYPPDLIARWRSIPIATESPVADAARDREVIVCETFDEIVARYPSFDRTDEAFVTAPLVVAGRVIGSVFIGASEPTRFGPFELGLVLSLARQSAQALDRALLFEREQESASRVRRLQTVTAALSQAVTVEDVSRTCVEEGALAIGATAGLVAIVPPASTELEIAYARGYDAPGITQGMRLPAGAGLSLARAARTGLPVWAPAVADPGEAADARETSLGEVIRRSIVLPLGAGTSTPGALCFTFTDPPDLSAAQREWMISLAGQCTQALDRAGRFESERAIAETLQRSVLPGRLPELDDVEIAARYLPGTAGVDVGGDWYDAIRLEGGFLGLVVGDVVGKGVRAAATMAQLRNGLRAFAFEHVDPEEALVLLNGLVDGLADAPFATLAYVVLDPGGLRCRYVVAGHPPPILVGPDGSARFLDEGRALPLGVDGAAVFPPGICMLEPGSTLLLYTDGLVERRDRPLDQGLEALRLVTERGPTDPDALVDDILDWAFAGDERGDDVALLAVRLTAAPVDDLSLTLPARADGLVQMRTSLRSWLAAAGVVPAEVEDIVLAAWEACANAVEHAQEPARETFELDAARDGHGGVRLSVRDSGRWKPALDGAASDRGLGLVLIRSLMHEVEVTPSDTGTVIAMKRQLGTANGGLGSGGRG